MHMSPRQHLHQAHGVVLDVPRGISRGISVRAAGAGVCACFASAAGAGLRAAMRRCAAGEGSTGGGSWRGAAGASSFYRK